jgi:hypothetical protein
MSINKLNDFSLIYFSYILISHKFYYNILLKDKLISIIEGLY